MLGLRDERMLVYSFIAKRMLVLSFEVRKSVASSVC